MRTKIIASSMLLSATLCAQTIWMVGDSTMAGYGDNRAPLTGWGQVLNEYCKPGVEVQNKAISGYSSKNFVDSGKLAAFAERIGKGDYLIIQFGHNDQKKEKPTHYTDPESTFPEYLGIFIKAARDKGATPLLVTPICRRLFKDGKVRHSLGGYPDAIRKLAEAEKLGLVDLNKITNDRMNAMGEEDSIVMFNHLKPGESPNWPKGNTDNTHLNRKGAEMVAGWFAEDAKKQHLPIAELFK